MRLIQARRQPIGRRDVVVGDSTGTHWLDIPPTQKRMARNVWDWGEDNEGARQLAHAILYWVTGREKFSQDFARRFMGEVLNRKHLHMWTMMEEDVLSWCLDVLLVECGLQDATEEETEP